METLFVAKVSSNFFAAVYKKLILMAGKRKLYF